MGRGTPGYSTAHLRPLGQKPTSAGPASSCAATHAHITTQASSVGPTLHRPGTSTTAMSPRLEKNQNGRRQNAVCPRPGPTAGSRQRRPARRCRRLRMPRRRPSRLGQAGRRTLPALRPTLSPPKPPAPPNRPSTWRPKRWSHRASTTSGRTTAPTQYGYAVNADTRQARCPSKVNTSSPKPNGNRRATRAATS